MERLVGEGGFGAVWLAEQVAPVRRRIALKVLRARMPGPRLRARFEAERQLLARMEHPGVARIFDAGETDDGRLWFAMEFVEGERIDAWCDAHRAPLRTRISLMAQACAAVQHAHSKGVVHCDLKPNNVLVCEVDGAPLVKVIDFGVARVVDGSDAVPTMGSEAAGPLGTLEFMAPEQVRGSRDADTRTDVWALGVMLYEMLCGTLPFDSRTLRSGGLPAAAQMIAEAEPDPPSAALLSMAARDPERAAARALSRASAPRRLAAVLRQELDWVAMRCLEKDPDARYSGAAALAEDLARWMRDEPVVARAPGLGLRTRKFVRRHRLGVAVAATALVTLLAGLVGTGYGLVTAQRNLALAERNLDLANRQLQRFERLRDFNSSILGAVDPATARGMDTRLLRMMIDGASGAIDERFSDDALVAADVHRTVGVAYRSIGEWEQAESHLRRVLSLAEQQHGKGSPECARGENDLGEVLLARGRIDDASPLLESAHQGRLAALGPDHPDRLVSLHNLALLRDAQARLAESATLYAEALERRRAALGQDADATVRTLVNLAEVQRQLGKLDEARASLDAAVYRGGASIYYYRERAMETPIPFNEKILFLDEELLVVDKPHFLPVTPGGRFLRETLLVRLKRATGKETLTPIHRLDRETAGVMMFSVNPATRSLWQSLFRQRLVEKTYEAIASASVQAGLQFPIERRSRIVRDDQFFRMREVDGEANSHTRIELIEQRDLHALYRLYPFTLSNFSGIIFKSSQ